MGSNRSRGWRDAHLGGWFSYDLKVLPDQHQSLMCTYWGLDFGRIFHITVEDEDIALVTLTGDKGGEFFDMELSN